MQKPHQSHSINGKWKSIIHLRYKCTQSQRLCRQCKFKFIWYIHALYTHTYNSTIRQNYFKFKYSSHIWELIRCTRDVLYSMHAQCALKKINSFSHFCENYYMIFNDPNKPDLYIFMVCSSSYYSIPNMRTVYSILLFSVFPANIFFIINSWDQSENEIKELKYKLESFI